MMQRTGTSRRLDVVPNSGSDQIGSLSEFNGGFTVDLLASALVSFMKLGTI
jgi:hypothetical protein